MLVNQGTVLVGHTVLLVPYDREHVPRYHAWMQDPVVQEQTASDRLTIDQEYNMQQSWATDEDKLTFIILAKRGEDHSYDVKRDLDRMVGDVNIFFNPYHGEEDRRAGVDIERLDAECEIMIAEHCARRKGMGKEALQMMLNYVTADSIMPDSRLPIPAFWLTSKISLTNIASIALFESLGFTKHKVSEVWQEVEMRYSAPPDRRGLFPGSILHRLQKCK